MIQVELFIYNDTPEGCLANLWEPVGKDCFVCWIGGLADGVDIRFQDLRLFKAFVEIKQLPLQNQFKEPLPIEVIDRFIEKYQPETLPQNESADQATPSPQQENNRE